MRISLILPAYNEENGIVETLKMIPYKPLKQAGYDVEVIVVDNNSTDKTVAHAKKFPVTVVSETKQGYGYSYKKGFSVASGEVIVTADADGTYPLDNLLPLLELFKKENLDLLIANRFVGRYSRIKAMPSVNQLGNLSLSILLRLIFRITLRDSQSGMMLFKRDLLKHLRIRSNQMGFSQEIKIDAIVYNQCRWKEEQINYRPRIGKTKLRLYRDGLFVLANLIAKRIYR